MCGVYSKAEGNKYKYTALYTHASSQEELSGTVTTHTTDTGLLPKITLAVNTF